MASCPETSHEGVNPLVLNDDIIECLEGKTLGPTVTFTSNVLCML